MTIDPLRLAESAAGAVLVVGATILPVVSGRLGPGLLAVLVAMAALLTGGAYALHAVTFDCLRLTSQRADRFSLHTRRED
jgi:hypothetical protein